MTVGPPLAFPFPSSSATGSTSTTPSSSSASSTAPTTATSTPSPSTSTPPSTIPPITNHYGGGLPPSTQTCNTACAIALPAILLSLLILGLAFAYLKRKRRHPEPPLKSAIAAGSAPARAGHVPASHGLGRSTCAQRMRRLFGKREGEREAGAVGEGERGERFATLRRSVRRDPRARGYVDLDLEAGEGGGRSRDGSGGSEVTLAEAVAEGDAEARKLGA